MRNLIALSLLAVSIAIASCGSYETISGEDYGDIAAGDSGITLTQAEHPVGWGKAECFECHMTENMHQTDRTGTGLNLQAIQDMTREQGLLSCPTCHGTNGVQ